MVNKITFTIDGMRSSELVSKGTSHTIRQQFVNGNPKFTFMTYDGMTEITVDLSKISIISVTKATHQPHEINQHDGDV